MKTDTRYTNPSRGLRSLLVGMSAASLAIPARSQEATGSGTVHELDAYVVVANRYEMPIQQVGSSVEVLDRYDLQQGQQTFLLESLRQIPGFALRNTGGPGGVFGMTVRGLSTNRPTVLVNGIEVSNPSTGQMLNFGALLSANVSRVEILKGPQSSLYGADALAGVISIETLPAGDLAGTRGQFAYGSHESFQLGLGHSGSLDRWNWSIDLNRYETEGISAQDPAFGPEWADDDAYRATNLSGALRYDFSQETNAYLSVYYIDSYAEMDPGPPSPWNTPVFDNASESEELFLKLGGESRISDRWTTAASFGYSDVEYVSWQGYEYESRGERYKAEWHNTIEPSDSWRLVAGVEQEIEDNRSDLGDRENTSFFAENLFRVGERLDFTLGGRYDDNSLYGSEATYRGTFSYRLENSDARLRGSFGSSFQAPTFYELTNPSYGNPNLKPESGRGWDLGIEKGWAEGRLFLSGTLFGNKIDDKIVWDGLFNNVATYRSSGVETVARFRATESLALSATHTYSDAEEGGVEALRVPRNQYGLSARWKGLSDRLALSASALWLSSQYSDGEARSEGAKQPGYQVVNLAGEYALSEVVTLWARIDNALDEDYEEVAGYQTHGRSGMLGVRFQF